MSISFWEKKIPFINIILLILIFITIFIIPIFPTEPLQYLYPICFTLILLLAALSLENHRVIVLSAVFFLILIIWISIFTGFNQLKIVSRLVQIVFFFFLVAKLILQIAKKNKVTKQVIIESITGYFLMGLAFSTMVMLVAAFSPDAYNIQFIQLQNPELETKFDPLKDYFYYTFVTYTTTGYGDIVPLKPISKSLAILISVSGQLYVATIIAMLVGKYAASQRV
jgi:hypothetical protein